MIFVEVMVPSLGRRYDFELERSALVEVLIREMILVICQKERCESFEEEGRTFSLYSQASRRRLLPEATLQQNGVRNGHCLILV